MNIKTIIENMEMLAGEEMTENGIDHDEWTDREHEYLHEIMNQLSEILEYEQE